MTAPTPTASAPTSSCSVSSASRPVVVCGSFSSMHASKPLQDSAHRGMMSKTDAPCFEPLIETLRHLDNMQMIADSWQQPNVSVSSAAKALKDSRDAFFVATKFALTMDEQGNFGVCGSAEHVKCVLMYSESSECRTCQSHACTVSSLSARVAANSQAGRMACQLQTTQPCQTSPAGRLATSRSRILASRRSTYTTNIGWTKRSPSRTLSEPWRCVSTLFHSSCSSHNTTRTCRGRLKRISCQRAVQLLRLMCVGPPHKGNIQYGTPPMLVATPYCCRSWSRPARSSTWG